MSNKKVDKPKFKFLNNLYLKFEFFKKINLKQKKNIILNKEIFLGDTDIFLTIDKKKK